MTLRTSATFGNELQPDEGQPRQTREARKSDDSFGDAIRRVAPPIAAKGHHFEYCPAEPSWDLVDRQFSQQLEHDVRLSKEPGVGASGPYAALWEYDMGYFDDETCRLEPIDNPFSPKVLPMSSE